MAILSSSGIYGFLCSCKETGKQLANGAKEYVEHFLPGFAGHGWKIWKRNAETDKYCLEIDQIVVRETMTVFELLIQKLRAVKGALCITQASGKIKTATKSDDGLNWLITVEDEMSFVAHDIIRCQSWEKNSLKGYWVEISEITKGEDGADLIVVPVSEFSGSIDYDDEGFECVYPDLSTMPTPAIGDEIIQFGNSELPNRQSAIYLHADEGAQPAMDVLFGVNSKSFSGCVKTRVGGDIPGSGGLKGFYCENGMIKCVDSGGSTIYQLSPDGSFDLGRGKISYHPDTDKLTFGAGVELTWENLSDGSKDSLKEGSLPGFVKEWDKIENKTQIKGEYIVSPKMFSGTNTGTADEPTLTGIAMGRECIEIKGEKRTGIFALVNNDVVFELDPESGVSVFKGRVEAEEGTFHGEINAYKGYIGGFKIEEYGLSNDDNSDSCIYVDTTKNDSRRMAVLGNNIPSIVGIDTASMFLASGQGENRALKLSATGSTTAHEIFGGNCNFAIEAIGGVNWTCAKDDHWCMPGVLACSEIAYSYDSGISIIRSWGNGCELENIQHYEKGRFRLLHRLGHMDYYVNITNYMPNADGNAWGMIANLTSKSINSFEFAFKDDGGKYVDPSRFEFMLFGRCV